MAAARPDWLSDELYPFESRFFATTDGRELHDVEDAPERMLPELRAFLTGA